MRTRGQVPGPAGPDSSTSRGSGLPNLRDAVAVADLFVGVFRRDLAVFYPQAILQDPEGDPVGWDPGLGPNFRLVERPDEGVSIHLFGLAYRVDPRAEGRFSPQDFRMIRAIGAVLSLRYQHLFQVQHTSRLELYRGGSEDHYVAAFIEPRAYGPNAEGPSRIASTILTLRTAALSTYENRRVSTGALLLGDDSGLDRPSPEDALGYGVELTALKSVHRLCDGRRTLFLVDLAGRLVDVVDVARWSERVPEGDSSRLPCARDYEAHARATREGGHVCLVLSPNQEIKLFAGGSQQFAFAHGRWRMLDPAGRFAHWSSVVREPSLARTLFQAALNLAEFRQGGLFVILDEPAEAIGRLVAPQDVLAEGPGELPVNPPGPVDPLAKRALHYLARGRSVAGIDSTVLEALAGLDGAIVTDRSGRLIAFGAILRHDGVGGTGPGAEGARTTAALIASRFGPVLKVSEDGIISCFLGGARAWEL